MNPSHDSPHIRSRFPRLIMHNGPHQPSTLYLAPGIKLRLTPSQTNIMLVLKKEWVVGERLDPEDRGWINAERLIEAYLSIIKRTIETAAATAYANRTMHRIENSLKLHRSSLPALVERSTGQGFHLTTDLLIIDSNGREWPAQA